MEAATARYAARDRFAYPTEPAATPLQRYIQNACSPENFEPNLALCLEIADLINAKKGNAPREAAIAIVGYINHRNPNVSLLALSLLDICVKNCGYPFHLQISTKEFLNELVRRFPERPPVRTTRVQNRILELIEEWRWTICETSKYKEDLGFIRDMHRLLSYKGYVFPEIRREDAAVLNPSDNLKSAEEMEAEERAAQSAKLQELIRRGTPHDLQEANKLMKVMAGYDTRHKTDYRAKAAEEVARIQQKAKLLEEMLQGYKPGDEIKEGDVYEELANALASAHPKIQKMCEEESEDHEAVAKLFEINDSIHRTIERYRLVKKGDLEGANKIPRGTLGVSGAGVKRGVDNELSLIDFGGPEDAAAPTVDSAQTEPVNASKGNALEDDLLGLNMGDGNFGEGGGISLGGGSAPSNGPVKSTADIMAQFSQPAQPQQSSSTSTANSLLFSSPPSISQPQFQQAPPPHQPASKSNFDFFGAAPPSAGSQPSSKPATPAPSSTQAPTRKIDPFASLSTATPPRQASPSPAQFQQSIPVSKSPAVPISSKPTPPRVERASTFDLLGMGNGTLAPSGSTIAAQSSSRPSTGDQTKKAEDDEWTFSSALPDQPEELVVTDSSIRTVFTIIRTSERELEIRSRISNSTAETISDLTFQLAVTKIYTLHLQPQSGRSLSPNQQNGITQIIRLEGVERGNGTAVKLRWRASYVLAGAQKNEQGEIQGLGVA